MRYMEENEREKFMSHRQSGDCYHTVNGKKKKKRKTQAWLNKWLTKAPIAQKIFRFGGGLRRHVQ